MPIDDLIAEDLDHCRNSSKPVVIRSLPPIYELFKDWCKETNRNGGVIIGPSIREFCTWCDLKIKESCGGNVV